MGCQYFDKLSVNLKCFNMNFLFIHELLFCLIFRFMFLLNALYDFKYDTDKAYISYIFYSPTRPSCLILFYLVSDVGPTDVEAERAVVAIAPPLEREWQPNDVMYRSCWDLSFDNIFWGVTLILGTLFKPLLAFCWDVKLNALLFDPHNLN